MLGSAKKSTSPAKKAGQSKYQKDKAAQLLGSKSVGALPSTRGILKVGNGTLSLGRGRNKGSYDILSQSMTLKEPLDGTYGEEHYKLVEKQRECPPETPVTALARELMQKNRVDAEAPQ